MKITKEKLQSLYPVPEGALEQMDRLLAALPAGKEKIQVKKKLSATFVLAAVLTLLAVGALAAALGWDVMHFLYGGEKSGAPLQQEAVNAFATDGRVSVTIASAAHDGRALALDWTIESHQPQSPVYMEIASLTANGEILHPTTMFAGLNRDWLRPGEETRRGGDIIILPQGLEGENIRLEMTVAVYQPLKPVKILEEINPEEKEKWEAEGYFVAMPQGILPVYGGEKLFQWHLGKVPKDTYDQYARTELHFAMSLPAQHAPLQALRTADPLTTPYAHAEILRAVKSPLGIYVDVALYPQENTEKAARRLSSSLAVTLADSFGDMLPRVHSQQYMLSGPGSYLSTHMDDEGRWYELYRISYVGYDEEQLPEILSVRIGHIGEEGMVDGEFPLHIWLNEGE